MKREFPQDEPTDITKPLSADDFRASGLAAMKWRKKHPHEITRLTYKDLQPILEHLYGSRDALPTDSPDTLDKE